MFVQCPAPQKGREERRKGEREERREKARREGGRQGGKRVGRHTHRSAGPSKSCNGENRKGTRCITTNRKDIVMTTQEKAGQNKDGDGKKAD